MDSIPPEKPSKIACKVAFELGLPWRVEELREKAEEARRTAELPSESLGLLREKAYTRMRKGIYEQVKKAGKGMESLRPTQKKPTPGQIETALKAFTAKQWAPVERWPPIALSPPMEEWPIIEYRFGLMESVGRVEVETLLSYIRQNTDELKQRLGTRKVEQIEGCAIMRDTELWLDENRSKLVPISDVYWAVALRDLALEANTKGKGHPAKGPPMAEQAKAPHIARRLTKRDEQTGHEMNVSAYEVRQWWKRVEEVPFEQFAADVGADDEEKRAAALIDYWIMIRKKYQHKK